MKKIFIAVVLMLGLTGCRDIFDSSDNPIIYGPTDDHMEESVKANLPTAVLSQFDETSMGAALVRRLPYTTREIQPNTKMVLIKGEDILSRPMTEWLEAAKIYLKGGYIAIEKPHDAHLVHFMEKLTDKMAQAEAEVLTGDLGNGVTATITPPENTNAAARIGSAHGLRLQTRIANIGVRSNTRGDSEAKPVAEMVIFAPTCYYSCDPYENEIVVSSNSDSDEKAEELLTSEYTTRSSGLLADGAARWLNDQQKTLAKARAATRANGEGAINEMMSASEEQTIQHSLFSHGWNGETRKKPFGYLETIRIWGSHNMDTNKDYYYVQQKALIAIGGKQDGDARLDPTKTLYAGPYKKDEYIKADYKYDGYSFKKYYGAWFEEGQFNLGLTGNAGTIKIEDAIPTTDNNNTSTSIAVGETHSQTNTVGFSLSAIISSSPGANLGFNYSHGWTDGTTYTMTTTTNVKEIKVTKNTEGNTIKWNYNNTLDFLGKSTKNTHPIAPDAIISDVNIDNQACWSVSNPEGAYTLQTYRDPTLRVLFHNNDGHYQVRGMSFTPKDKSFELLIPNRATQTWRMDVTFPEIGEPGHEGQKAQLIEALQRHFPDLYQPTMDLADKSQEAENTIKGVFAMSQQLILNSDGSQTMKEYAKDLGISQYTIQWYTTDGKHSKYEVTVTAE